MTPSLFYLIVAGTLIVTELLVMGFSVFWFLFFGLGALVTSLLCYWMPEISWFNATTIFIISSLSIAALLYPVLRKWQQKPPTIAGNDVIGQTAKVIAAINADKQGKVFWSGSEWAAQAENQNEVFEVGDKVVIIRVEGIRLVVARA